MEPRLPTLSRSIVIVKPGKEGPMLGGKRIQAGFTIIEMLVVVSIIALLVAMLLPALGAARDKARSTVSKSNLRQIGQGHVMYAQTWNDRHVTWVKDNISQYGNTAPQAFTNYALQRGPHPRMVLGHSSGQEVSYNPTGGNWYPPLPFTFDGLGRGFGSFRIPNALALNRYVSDRFYHPVWYAPNDAVPMSVLEDCLNDPNSFCLPADGRTVYWSSYALSPAIMLSPNVLEKNKASGKFYRNPWELTTGFRTPTMSQALSPDLKTHLIEHHWIHGRRADCQSSPPRRTYDGCEPYYFNHSLASQPASLFLDGHVEMLSVRAAVDADHRAADGLWSRDTPMGADGYFGASAFGDTPASGFHILTINGIRGRDRDPG